MRSKKQIQKEESIAMDKVWYDRHQMCMEKIYPKTKDIKVRKLYEDAEKIAKKMAKQYGKKNIGPYNDFEWGMLNGRLETLRWIMGEDWGMLDT